MSDNYEQQFMQNVNEKVSVSNKTAPKKSFPIAVFLIVNLIVSTIVIILLIVLLITGVGKSNTPVAEDISEDEMPSRQYDDNGALAAINLSCASDDAQFVFYLDNSFSISSIGEEQSPQVLQFGDYEIDDKSIITTSTDGSSMAFSYIGKSLVLENGETIECEEF